eukprot:scaffold256111_cov33-Tisochrysis_lutea.AAC.2
MTKRIFLRGPRPAACHLDVHALQIRAILMEERQAHKPPSSKGTVECPKVSRVRTFCRLPPSTLVECRQLIHMGEPERKNAAHLIGEGGGA